MNIRVCRELIGICAAGAIFVFAFAAVGCDAQRYMKEVGTVPSVIESSAVATTTRPSMTETTKAPTVYEDKPVTTTTTEAEDEEAEPTKKPTAKPTKKPTAKPTKKPTAKPTKKPTAKPTKKPTAKPTKKPTNKPTNKPVKKTASKPTNKPTNKPTATPTNTPAAVPTNTPTPKPEAKLLTKNVSSSNTTVKKIAEKYTGSGSEAVVDSTDLDKMKVTITVSDQNDSSKKTVWVMEGKFVSSTGTMEYSACVKSVNKYDEGELVSKTISYLKSQGTITIKDGMLTWNDSKESIADNKTFIDPKTHDHGPC